MSERTDAQLVAAHADGDRSAFEEIVSRYESRVWAVAIRMCGNPEDARDVMQDVFVSALTGLTRFRAEAQLGTWFHRVAVNAALDLLRKRSRRRGPPIEEAPDVAAPGPGPDEQVIASDRQREVRAAIAALSEEHRAVIVLADLQQLDYAAVAEALAIPIGTVKSRVHRARLALAQALGHLKEAPSQPSETPNKRDAGAGIDPAAGRGEPNDPQSLLRNESS